jgi:hypothetical protein
VSCQRSGFVPSERFVRKKPFPAPLPSVVTVLVPLPLPLFQRLSSRAQKLQVVSASPPCPDYSEVLRNFSFLWHLLVVCRLLVVRTWSMDLEFATCCSPSSISSIILPTLFDTDNSEEWPFTVLCSRRECRAENTPQRRDRTAKGLRTKPSAEQPQPGAYDLYHTCRLRITGKQLASSGRACVCVCVCVRACMRACVRACACFLLSLYVSCVRTCVRVSRFLYLSLSLFIFSMCICVLVHIFRAQLALIQFSVCNKGGTPDM